MASFDPDGRPDPLLDHGRGLFIMGALMDSLELRVDGGLEVRMARKVVARREPAPVDSGLGERVAGGVGHREARTRALLEEIDEAFVALDWEYRYVYVNAHACRLLGKSRDEMLGHKLFTLFPKLHDTELDRGFRAAMELGRPSAMEWHSPVLDAWIETRIYPTTAGVTAYFHDISERRRKEEERDELLDALSASQAMLERSQELAHLGSWELDLANGHLTWSDEVYRIFGLAPQEFGATYEAFLERVHPDDRAAVDAAYSGSLREDRDSYEIEHRVVRKDSGEIRYVEERCDHLRDAAGTMVRSVGMVHDITERKRAEGERQRLLEELKMQALVLQAETGDLTHRAALADSLSAINRLMLSSLDAGAIMQFALDEGVRALAVDAGTIEMREEPHWVVSYQRGLLDVASGLRLGEAEAPVATSVEKNGVARTVVDVQAQPELNVGFVRTNALRSELAVPLLARASVVGCLFFYGKQPRTFDDAEVDFARKLGATVSLALENARLYEEQQHIAATLQEHFMHERPLVAGLELGLVSRSATRRDSSGATSAMCSCSTTAVWPS